MLEKDKIIQAVSSKGTVIPKDLLSMFNVDTFIMGAFLSELVREGRLMVTSVKMGGSPFYYIPEHKQKIQELSKFLNEKDRRAFALIKEKHLLRDLDLTPLQRVSMRAIRDFAKPLEIQLSVSSDSVLDTKELFWKWYLLSNEEAKEIIDKLKPLPSQQNQQLYVKKQEPQYTVSQEAKPKQTPPMVPYETKQEQPIITQKVSIKEKIKKMVDEVAGVEQTTPSSLNTLATQPPQTPASELISPKLDQEHLPTIISPTKQKISTQQPLHLSKSQKPKKAEELQTKIQSPSLTTEESTIISSEQLKSELFSLVQRHFNKNNISSSNIEIIRKEKEIDCIVHVPSPVGDVEYYCRIKSKKRCNDGDLAAAFVTAQTKGLPALFITTGEITKKAQEMLTTKFKNMKVVTLN